MSLLVTVAALLITHNTVSNVKIQIRYKLCGINNKKSIVACLCTFIILVYSTFSPFHVQVKQLKNVWESAPISNCIMKTETQKVQFHNLSRIARVGFPLKCVFLICVTENQFISFAVSVSISIYGETSWLICTSKMYENICGKVKFQVKESLGKANFR